MSAMASKIMLLKITVEPDNQGMDIVLFVCKLGSLLQNYSTHTKVLHKFKVTGEPRIVAVVQVEDVVGLERTIAGLYRLGNVSVSCTPMYNYDDYASTILKVDKDLLGQPPAVFPNNDLYWLEFHLEYHGKTIEELQEICKKEATVALNLKAKGQPLALYKVAMERKVHCFTFNPDISKLDELSVILPIMTLNGQNVHVTCKAIQHLDDFKQNVC